MFKKTGQTLVYKDAWLELFQDELQFPDGSFGTYAWVKRKNGVAVSVVTNDEKILLQKEYRHVIDRSSWEVPGGGIDQGETPESAAVRELSEEVGLVVTEEQLVLLGRFYPLNSFNTEFNALFMIIVASDTMLGANQTEHGEAIEEHRFIKFDQALKMIDSGEINDAFTANAVQLAIRTYAKTSTHNGGLAT